MVNRLLVVCLIALGLFFITGCSKEVQPEEFQPPQVVSTTTWIEVEYAQFGNFNGTWVPICPNGQIQSTIETSDTLPEGYDALASCNAGRLVYLPNTVTPYPTISLDSNDDQYITPHEPVYYKVDNNWLLACPGEIKIPIDAETSITYLGTDFIPNCQGSAERYPTHTPTPVPSSTPLPTLTPIPTMTNTPIPIPEYESGFVIRLWYDQRDYYDMYFDSNEFWGTLDYAKNQLTGQIYGLQVDDIEVFGFEKHGVWVLVWDDDGYIYSSPAPICKGDSPRYNIREYVSGNFHILVGSEEKMQTNLSPLPSFIPGSGEPHRCN